MVTLGEVRFGSANGFPAGLLPDSNVTLMGASRMITSRERVNLALQHKEADRVPSDLGGTMVTGMHVSTVYKLRQLWSWMNPAHQ